MSSASNSSDRKLDNFAPTEILSTDPSKKVYEDTLAFDSSASGTKTPSLLGEVKAEENSDPDAPPKNFGRYRISKLLGRGGMGSVYLAQDTQLDRPVALKIPRMEADRHGRMMARFQREAKAVALLNHPHICPVFDVGEIDGQPFLAMAYIKGKPLSSFLAKGSQQPERGIASTIYKIALAIQEAHANGILHRDLKPANIMIDSRGEPIVMDFGLSHRLNDDGESRLTQEGTVIGTPSYMAPEQIDGREPISPATDVYSLGVVLYELLTGKCPFQGSIVSVIGQVLHNDPPPIDQARADLSPAIVEICKRAMAKEPGDRYPSMKDFAAALAGFLRGQTTVVATTPVSATVAQPDLTSASLDDLFSSSELQAALATSSLHTLPAPETNSNQLLRVLIPATVGILVLLGLVAFAFRSKAPGEKVAEATPGVTQPNTSGEEEEAASSRDSAVEPKVEPDPASVAEPTTSSAGDFFPKSVKTFTPGEPANSANDAASSGEAEASEVESPREPSPIEAGTADPAEAANPAKPASESAGTPQESNEPKQTTAAESKPEEERNPLSFPPQDGPSSSPNTYSPLSLNPLPEGAKPATEEPVDKDSPEYLAKIFHEADRNHDEYLDPSEAPMHIIHRVDTNHDRLASLREMENAFKVRKKDLFKPPTPVELKNLKRGPGKPFGGKPPGPPPR